MTDDEKETIELSPKPEIADDLQTTREKYTELTGLSDVDDNLFTLFLAVAGKEKIEREFDKRNDDSTEHRPYCQ